MDFPLHKGQLKVYQDGHRFVTLVAGRRFGKTRLALTRIITTTLGFPREPDPVSPEITLVTMPTLQMARGIIWTPLVNLFETPELAPAVKRIDRSNFRIDLYGKPSIQVAGANDKNGDGLRGKRIWFFLGDEWQDVKATVLDEVIIPAMADTPGSTALFTGTPKGRQNHYYRLFQRAEEDPEQYSSYLMPTWDNPLIPRDFLARQKLLLPPRVYDQEFGANFVNFPGQFYSELTEDNLVDRLPDGFTQTILGVDFGDVHPAIVALGLRGSTWYYLEGWQGSTGQPIPEPTFHHHIRRMAARWNPSGVYCDPSRPSAILTIRSLGLPMAIAGYNRILEGITQVHSLIYQRRLKFPTENPQGLHEGSIIGRDAYELALSYHARTVDGVATDKVEDGQDDHILDAIRYALALPGGLPGVE
jgi:hypothetical protein